MLRMKLDRRSERVRFTATTAVGLATILTVSSCAGAHGDRGPTFPTDSRDQVQALVDRVVALDGVTWSGRTEPAASDCLLDDAATRGVVFSWAVRGTSADNPKTFADRAAEVMEQSGANVSAFTRDSKDIRLHLVQSRDARKPAVSFSASTVNTMLLIDSVCVPATSRSRPGVRNLAPT